MPTRIKHIIIVTLYLIALTASYAGFRHILYWDIHRAIQTGDQERVLTLIQRKPRLAHARNQEGQTPLHRIHGFARPIPLCSALLAKGADINAKDNWSRTPLHCTIQADRKELFGFLIEQGADINAIDNGDCTPLNYAASNGRKEMAEHLIEKGAPVDSHDNTRRPPLIDAAAAGHIEIMEILIAAGADVNRTVTNRGTILHYLIDRRRNKTEVYKLLLEKGADPNIKDRHGRTPLSLAQKHKLTEIADLLQTHTPTEPRE